MRQFFRAAKNKKLMVGTQEGRAILLRRSNNIRFFSRGEKVR